MTEKKNSHEDMEVTAGVDGDAQALALGRAYMEWLRRGHTGGLRAFAATQPYPIDGAIECLEGIELAYRLERSHRAAHSAPGARPESRDGEPIGDFRIIREIGRGGMGIVYEAIQISLGRRVALKILPFAAAIDERRRRRFLLEAQAAAQLHHSHIVPVYAVGCDRGTHYYAMQLIDGRPLSRDLFQRAIDETPNSFSRRLQSTLVVGNEPTTKQEPTKRGSNRQRVHSRFHWIAMLIANAADALEHAHACGIVHRDVKPGNLLLDIHGKIWITDFGLAQFSANEALTQSGDLLGTMRYMSPEQASGARGVVDHRSDVYSLGATLYELIAGAPAHSATDRPSLLQAILHDDPTPPRQLDPQIPEELEVITLKAMRQTPHERYDSASEFADDLRCFLQEMPIAARRPTTRERIRKWSRRHPSLVMAGLSAMGIAMVSFAAMTAIVSHQKRLTEQALAREQDRAAEAERRLTIAQRAADEMIHLAENELSRTPMEETLRLRLYSSALENYEALIDDSASDEKTRSRLQATRDRIARVRDDLSLLRSDRELQALLEPAALQAIGLNPKQSDPRIQEVIDSLRQADQEDDLLTRARRRQDLLSQSLSASQWERLHQVALQIDAPISLIQSIVSGKIEISESKFESIQGVVMKYVSDRGLAFPIGPGPSGRPAAGWSQQAELPTGQPERRDFTAAQRRELTERILSLLGPVQREQWRALIGEPLVLP
jgi:eukaryotic-like serine/threonine-protein kinase